MNNKKREFIGFLMGEGCFRIGKYKDKKAKKHSLIRGIVTVSLRADDGNVLKWAQKEYGGTLMLRQGRPQIPNQNPYYMWVMTSSPKILRLLDDFLLAELPSVKIKQAKLLKEFCEFKVNYKRRGTGYTDKEYNRQIKLMKEISRLKKYQGKE